MSGFDALDFFQAQKQQERSALRVLEDSKSRLAAAREAVETLELELIKLTKSHDGLKKRRAAALGTSQHISNVSLLTQRAGMLLSAERAVGDKVAQMQTNLQKLEEKLVSENSPVTMSGRAFAQAQAEIDGHIANVHMMNKETAAKLVHLDAANAEIAKLLNDRCDLERQVKERMAKRTECHHLVENCKLRISTLNHEILREDNEAKNLRQKRLDEQLLQLQDQIEANKKALDAETEEMERSKQAICSLISKNREALSSLTQESETLKEKLSVCTKTIDEETTDFEKKHDETNAEIAQARNALRQLQESAKDESTLWAARVKTEDALLMQYFTETVAPKREAVAKRKAALHELRKQFNEMASSFADEYSNL